MAQLKLNQKTVAGLHAPHPKRLGPSFALLKQQPQAGRPPVLVRD